VKSVYFLAVNGVKQGGVLSPVLFCLYIDDLLLTLFKSGVGCFIGNNFVRALAYADDIVLVAPTASALRRLLPVCGDFASEYCISFNAAKSKCLIILPNNLAVGLIMLKIVFFVLPINKLITLSHSNILVT
jgi:Reverse transcriptase (RNA-dependent DNA polymerase)